MLNVVTILSRVVMGAEIQALLAVSKMKLFQNNITPNQNTLLAELTEADFTGYVEATLTVWGDPYTDVINGGVSITAPSHQFVTTDPTTIPNTIYGYWIETAGEISSKSASLIHRSR